MLVVIVLLYIWFRFDCCLGGVGSWFAGFEFVCLNVGCCTIGLVIVCLVCICFLNSNLGVIVRLCGLVLFLNWSLFCCLILVALRLDCLDLIALCVADCLFVG